MTYPHRKIPSLQWYHSYLPNFVLDCDLLHVKAWIFPNLSDQISIPFDDNCCFDQSSLHFFGKTSLSLCWWGK